MTWVKLDDSFPHHPKVLEVGRDAAWLYVCGLCYSSRYLTDGFIPTASLSAVTNERRPAVQATKLVEAGMWDLVEGGWRIHDYDKHQRSREQIEAERESASRRQSRFRNGVTNGQVTAPETEKKQDNPPTPLPGGNDRVTPAECSPIIDLEQRLPATEVRALVDAAKRNPRRTA